MKKNEFPKDPDAKLDYLFDWSEWLESGETLSSYTITLSSTDIAKVSDSNDGSSITVWISGGTNQTWYTVACKIETSSGREDERTMRIYVNDR